MQPDGPTDESMAPDFGAQLPVEVAEMEHAQAVEWFGFVLKGYVPEEMADAEIERAFRAALVEWRRTEPERAAIRAEMQRQDQEELAERQRYWEEHPEERPQPMFDPPWVFRGGKDGDVF